MISRFPRVSSFLQAARRIRAESRNNEFYALNYTHIFRVCQEKTRKIIDNDVYAPNYTYIFRVCQEKNQNFWKIGQKSEKKEDFMEKIAKDFRANRI